MPTQEFNAAVKNILLARAEPGKKLLNLVILFPHAKQLGPKPKSLLVEHYFLYCEIVA
jgi:hypothetical protein